MKVINVLGLFCLSLCTGCESEQQEKQQEVKPVKVEVMRISNSQFRVSRNFSGTVETESNTSLSFSTAGTIQNVFVTLGNRVKKGDLIATIDSTTMQSSYDAAKATLEQAEDAYGRLKVLYEQNSLPEIKWVEVQSKLKQAKSVEEMAKKHLKDSRLYAPFSGVISEKSAEVGQNVAPGIPVVKLVNVKHLKVKICVPEEEISHIEIGDQAFIEIPAVNMSNVEGVVVEKGVVANPLTRSYDVKIRVEQSDGILLPGMVTTVHLFGKEKTGGVVIPANIVQLDEYDHTFVWVQKNGKAHKQLIQCGEYTAQGVVILNGLEMGDEIIVKGQQKVCEGTSLTF